MWDIQLERERDKMLRRAKRKKTNRATEVIEVDIEVQKERHGGTEMEDVQWWKKGKKGKSGTE